MAHAAAAGDFSTVSDVDVAAAYDAASATAAALHAAPAILENLSPLQVALATYTPVFDAVLAPETSALLTQFSGLVASKLAVVSTVNPDAAASIDANLARLIATLGGSLQLDLASQAQASAFFQLCPVLLLLHAFARDVRACPCIVLSIYLPG